MGRTDQSGALREITPPEAALFAEWEKNERPYPWSENQFLRGATALAWDEGGAAAGFAVMQVTGEEAYLQNLMIEKSKRRHGRGERLLRAVIDWARARGARILVLDVDPKNKPALALYEKCGFNVFERRKASYPRGEDAVVMGRRL